MSYKILSIDGGGMHGLFSVHFLKRLINKYPSLIHETDLIAGTSIGGIISLGLAMGHNIDTIERNFMVGIPLAFRKKFFQSMMFLMGMRPKYDNGKFKRFLDRVYEGKTLGELTKKVVIPTFCLDNKDEVNRRWKAKFFHNFGMEDDKMLVADIAMATASPPVYFKTYGNYVDGAIVANNPSMAALTITQDPRTGIYPKLDELRILSIGSIRNIYVEGEDLKWGYLRWIRPLIQLFTERDVLVVNYQCDKLIGHHFKRIQPVINHPMDDVDAAEDIGKMGLKYPIDDVIEWLNIHWK